MTNTNDDWREPHNVQTPTPTAESEGYEEDEFGAPIRVSEETVVQRIAPLVRKRAEIAEELADYECRVKQLEDQIRSIDEQQLPAMLDELGVDHIGVPLGDGRRISIKVEDSIHASLPVRDPEKRRRGLAWLRANDHGSVITRAFGIEFKSSAKEREAAAKFEAYLKAYDGKIAVKDNDSVHHGTLTSLVKELLAEGKAPPDVLEVLGAHVTRKAKIS